MFFLLQLLPTFSSSSSQLHHTSQHGIRASPIPLPELHFWKHARRLLPNLPNNVPTSKCHHHHQHRSTSNLPKWTHWKFQSLSSRRNLHCQPPSPSHSLQHHLPIQESNEQGWSHLLEVSLPRCLKTTCLLSNHRWFWSKTTRSHRRSKSWV